MSRDRAEHLFDSTETMTVQRAFALFGLPLTQPGGTGVSQRDMKQQYRELARQQHPDKNPGEDTTAKFQVINSAMEFLQGLGDPVVCYAQSTSKQVPQSKDTSDGNKPSSAPSYDYMEAENRRQAQMRQEIAHRERMEKLRRDAMEKERARAEEFQRNPAAHLRHVLQDVMYKMHKFHKLSDGEPEVFGLQRIHLNAEQYKDCVQIISNLRVLIDASLSESTVQETFKLMMTTVHLFSALFLPSGEALCGSNAGSNELFIAKCVISDVQYPAHSSARRDGASLFSILCRDLWTWVLETTRKCVLWRPLDLHLFTSLQHSSPVPSIVEDQVAGTDISLFLTTQDSSASQDVCIYRQLAIVSSGCRSFVSPACSCCAQLRKEIVPVLELTAIASSLTDMKPHSAVRAVQIQLFKGIALQLYFLQSCALARRDDTTIPLLDVLEQACDVSCKVVNIVHTEFKRGVKTGRIDVEFNQDSYISTTDQAIGSTQFASDVLECVLPLPLSTPMSKRHLVEVSANNPVVISTTAASPVQQLLVTAFSNHSNTEHAKQQVSGIADLVNWSQFLRLIAQCSDLPTLSTLTQAFVYLVAETTAIVTAWQPERTTDILLLPESTCECTQSFSSITWAHCGHRLEPRTTKLPLSQALFSVLTAAALRQANTVEAAYTSGLQFTPQLDSFLYAESNPYSVFKQTAVSQLAFPLNPSGLLTRERRAVQPYEYRGDSVLQDSLQLLCPPAVLSAPTHLIDQNIQFKAIHPQCECPAMQLPSLVPAPLLFSTFTDSVFPGQRVNIKPALINAAVPPSLSVIMTALSRFCCVNSINDISKPQISTLVERNILFPPFAATSHKLGCPPSFNVPLLTSILQKHSLAVCMTLPRHIVPTANLILSCALTLQTNSQAYTVALEGIDMYRYAVQQNALISTIHRDAAFYRLCRQLLANAHFDSAQCPPGFTSLQSELHSAIAAERKETTKPPVEVSSMVDEESIVVTKKIAGSYPYLQPNGVFAGHHLLQQEQQLNVVSHLAMYSFLRKKSTDLQFCGSLGCLSGTRSLFNITVWACSPVAWTETGAVLSRNPRLWHHCFTDFSTTSTNMFIPLFTALLVNQESEKCLHMVCSTMDISQLRASSTVIQIVASQDCHYVPPYHMAMLTQAVHSSESCCPPVPDSQYSIFTGAAHIYPTVLYSQSATLQQQQQNYYISAIIQQPAVELTVRPCKNVHSVQHSPVEILQQLSLDRAVQLQTVLTSIVIPQSSVDSSTTKHLDIYKLNVMQITSKNSKLFFSSAPSLSALFYVLSQRPSHSLFHATCALHLHIRHNTVYKQYIYLSQHQHKPSSVTSKVPVLSLAIECDTSFVPAPYDMLPTVYHVEGVTIGKNSVINCFQEFVSACLDFFENNEDRRLTASVGQAKKHAVHTYMCSLALLPRQVYANLASSIIGAPSYMPMSMLLYNPQGRAALDTVLQPTQGLGFWFWEKSHFPEAAFSLDPSIPKITDDKVLDQGVSNMHAVLLQPFDGKVSKVLLTCDLLCESLRVLYLGYVSVLPANKFCSFYVFEDCVSDYANIYCTEDFKPPPLSDSYLTSQSRGISSNNKLYVHQIVHTIGSVLFLCAYARRLEETLNIDKYIRNVLSTIHDLNLHTFHGGEAHAFLVFFSALSVDLARINHAHWQFLLSGDEGKRQHGNKTATEKKQAVSMFDKSETAFWRDVPTDRCSCTDSAVCKLSLMHVFSALAYSSGVLFAKSFLYPLLTCLLGSHLTTSLDKIAQETGTPNLLIPFTEPAIRVMHPCGSSASSFRTSFTGTSVFGNMQTNLSPTVLRELLYDTSISATTTTTITIDTLYSPSCLRQQITPLKLQPFTGKTSFPKPKPSESALQFFCSSIPCMHPRFPCFALLNTCGHVSCTSTACLPHHQALVQQLKNAQSIAFALGSTESDSWIKAIQYFCGGLSTRKPQLYGIIKALANPHVVLETLAGLKDLSLQSKGKDAIASPVYSAIVVCAMQSTEAHWQEQLNDDILQTLLKKGKVEAQLNAIVHDIELVRESVALADESDLEIVMSDSEDSNELEQLRPAKKTPSVHSTPVIDLFAQRRLARQRGTELPSAATPVVENTIKTSSSFNSHAPQQNTLKRKLNLEDEPQQHVKPAMYSSLAQSVAISQQNEVLSDMELSDMSDDSSDCLVVKTTLPKPITRSNSATRQLNSTPTPTNITSNITSSVASNSSPLAPRVSKPTNIVYPPDTLQKLPDYFGMTTIQRQQQFQNVPLTDESSRLLLQVHLQREQARKNKTSGVRMMLNSELHYVPTEQDKKDGKSKQISTNIFKKP